MFMNSRLFPEKGSVHWLSEDYDLDPRAHLVLLAFDGSVN